jgi:hypothetical protein
MSGVRTIRSAARAAQLAHANVTTTAQYLNVMDEYLQELIEQKRLALAR